MKKMIDTIIEWLGTSNRWKHLVGGFVLGQALQLIVIWAIVMTIK